MSFLYFLEGIRNPVLDFLFSLITYCGDEIIFMAVGMIVFWCFSKNEGYYLLCVGFLGTVVGMLQAFEVVRASEFLSASAVSGAVTSALITSAAGLAGAIPCYVAYNYLLSRIDTITLEMDRAAIEIISFFERENRKEETED